MRLLGIGIAGVFRTHGHAPFGGADEFQQVCHLRGQRHFLLHPGARGLEVAPAEKQEAERKRVEAQGISDYQRIINQSLTEQQLQYEQIKAMKELALSQNSKVIIMGKGNTPVILDSKN